MNATESTFPKALVYILLVLPWLAFWGAITQNVADPDLFGYLAFGRLFFESPEFPYEDVFSYYPVNSPWVYHEWLTGVAFYKMFRLAGPWTLQVLKYCLGLGCLGFAWKTARLNKADNLAVAVCALMGTWVLAQGWSPVRAQAFTYFFFSMVLYVTERDRRKSNPGIVWALPPLFWVWSNLHGGFVAGLGLFFVYFCWLWMEGRQGKAKAYGAVFCLSVLVTLANPYGLDYWAYLARSLFMPRPFIVEWWSLPKALAHGFYLPATLLLLVMVLVSTALAAKMLAHRHPGILVLPVLVLMAFWHHRHGVFFALAFVAFAPGYISIKKPMKCREWLTAGLVVLCLAANLFLAGCQGWYFLSGSPFQLKTPNLEQAPYNAPNYPSGALEYIRKTGLKGNVLADFHWGEYLIWSLYPQCRIAVDGRYETVYPKGVVHEHFLCFENPGVRPQDFFGYVEKYPTDMIITPAYSTAHRLLAQSPAWKPVYQDSGSALFVSRDDGKKHPGGLNPLPDDGSIPDNPHP